MKPPSTPQINKDNPAKWFIFWNQDVPAPLWERYPRRRVRIKKYDDINRMKGQARDEYAEYRRKVWQYSLERLKYDPFQEELTALQHYNDRKEQLNADIEQAEQALLRVEQFSEEDKRKLVPVSQALAAFVESRRKRKLEWESLSAYQGLVDWVNEGLEANGYHLLPVGQLRHIHLSAALDYIAEEREWAKSIM